MLGAWVGASTRYRKLFPATPCGLDHFLVASCPGVLERPASSEMSRVQVLIVFPSLLGFNRRRRSALNMHACWSEAKPRPVLRLATEDVALCRNLSARSVLPARTFMRTCRSFRMTESRGQGGALLLNPRHDQMRRTGSERGQPRANDVSARVNASSAIRRRRGRKEDRWMGQRHRGSVGTTATGTRCRVSRQGRGTRDGDGVVRCTETQTACVRRCRLAPTAPPPSAVGQGPSRRSWASTVARAGRSNWGCGTKASTRPRATACSVDVINRDCCSSCGPGRYRHLEDSCRSITCSLSMV